MQSQENLQFAQAPIQAAPSVSDTAPKASVRALPSALSIVLLLLCPMVLLVPRIGFPLFDGFDLGLIKGLMALFQGVTSIDELTSAATDISWGGLWQSVQSSGPSALGIFIVLLVGLILTLLFLLVSAILSLIALIQSLRARARSAYLLLFWTALMLALALLAGNVAIMLSNSLFGQMLHDKIGLLGLQYQNLRYVAPTIWSWLMLMGTAALMFASLLLRRRVSKT